MSEDHTTVVRLLQYLLQKGKEEAGTKEDNRKNSVEGCAVVAECARCLGELGSVDLKQVALPDVNKIDDCACESICLLNTVHMYCTYRSSNQILFQLNGTGMSATKFCVVTLCRV